MDCSKCGYALSAFEKDCPRCRRVAAEEFARSPASVWPPAVGPQNAAVPAPVPPAFPAFSPSVVDNSSGEERGGPPEVEGLHWNWGAFFCGWLWCFFHKTPGFAVLIIAAGLFLSAFSLFILPAGYALPSELMAVVVFGLCCYLGMHGHRMAWERRRFLGGVSQFLAVQRAWAVGGAVAFGVSAVFCVTLGLLFMAAFRAYEARRQAVPSAPAAATAPTAPPPMVLRPAEPAPRRFLLSPTNGNDEPGDFQRHFNPNYHRSFEPRYEPPSPGNAPQAAPAFPDQPNAAPANPAPPAAAPFNAPAPSPSPSAGAEPSGPAPGTSSAPGQAPPASQAAPSAPYQEPTRNAPAPGSAGQ